MEPGADRAEHWRLFIAITAPEEVKAQLERAQAELRRALPEARITWTRREQFHLTLKFLGDVQAQRVEGLAGAVRAVCRGLSALDLRAQGVGCFPDLRFPRVLWAGVRDERAQPPRLPSAVKPDSSDSSDCSDWSDWSETHLARMQRAVEAAALDFTTERRPERFSGHVTLGRVKSLRRPEAEALARLAQGMEQRNFGQWRADAIEIMRSELSSQGARHTLLHALPLGE
jgi:2'-5' RNA ligase